MAQPRRVLGTVTSAQPAQRRLRIKLRKGYAHVAEQLNQVELELVGGEAMRCKVRTVTLGDDEAFVGLVPGVTRDNVARMRGARVLAPEGFRPGGTASFEIDELLGFTVADTGGVSMGTVSGVMDTKAGGILQIEKTRGGSMSLPAIPEVISAIDWETERVVVGDIAPFAMENDEE